MPGKEKIPGVNFFSKATLTDVSARPTGTLSKEVSVGNVGASAKADAARGVVAPSAQDVADAVAGKGKASAERNKKIGESNWGRGLLITSVAVGGAAVVVEGGYLAYQNIIKPAISRPVENLNSDIPVIHRNAEVTPFNMDLLDKKPQTVEIGKNAQIATDEDIQNTIKGPAPKIVSYASVKTLEDIPKIPLILSIGQEAGKVKISRLPTKGGFNGKAIDLPINLHVSVENEGARFGPPIPEGINTNEGEVFLAPGPNNAVIDGKLHFTTMYVKFKFDNDKYLLVIMGSNMPKSLATTDSFKNAPIADAGYLKHGRSLWDDIRQETGLKFNISDNPALFTNTSSEDIGIQIASYTKDTGWIMLPEPKITEGNLLITAPR